MASPNRLAEVGEEAFKWLDQIERESRAQVHHFSCRPQSTETRFYAPPPVIDSFEAAQRYGGKGTVEHYMLPRKVHGKPYM